VSIGSREGTRKFFELLTDAAGQQGWLLVWLLKIDQIVVAMEYDLEYKGVVYALRADFDETYGEYSPGAYLEYHVIKYVFEQGYLEYNTGPGLNAYKLHWTNEFKENVALHLCNHNLRASMIGLFEGRMRPLLTRIRNVLFRTGSKP
jgi:CelD/BcsL family acetyltransferase involved in cellulose biosynthesis